ncbi:hypothetical protein TNCV_2266691, partial [Trichonephila clavipes]
ALAIVVFGDTDRRNVGRDRQRDERARAPLPAPGEMPQAVFFMREVAPRPGREHRAISPGIYSHDNYRSPQAFSRERHTQILKENRGFNSVSLRQIGYDSSLDSKIGSRLFSAFDFAQAAPSLALQVEFVRSRYGVMGDRSRLQHRPIPLTPHVQQ